MKARSGMDLCYSDLVQCIGDKGQKSIYVSCFSKHPDLLSQWRAYANDGQGVLIGIELDELVIADNIFLEEIIYCDTVIDEEKETIDRTALRQEYNLCISNLWMDNQTF